MALRHETLKEGHIKYEPFDREKVSERYKGLDTGCIFCLMVTDALIKTMKG